MSSSISISSKKQGNLQFLQHLATLFPSILSTIVNGERVVKVSPKDLLPLLTFLKHHTGREFAQLRDLTSIDSPERKFRFEVVYSLLSLSTHTRITISCSIAEGVSLPSVVSLYPSANWFEREVYDRRGIFFVNHPDLRRRLTDYTFAGHPLRKDFPVTGYVEVRYDDYNKRITYEPVNLSQEFRLFSSENPWSLF